MPRMYVSPSQFTEFPASLAFPLQVGQLQAVSGAMDQLLARASQRVDRYCRKRIGAPPLTAVGTGGITAGATALPVASTLGFDNGQEQAVIIGTATGGIQETIAVAPGGITVSSWTSPYAGEITLLTPVTYSHALGEPVQGCYQEVTTTGSSSSSDTWSDALISQQSQIAMAHAPRLADGNLTRIIFTKHYPILSVLLIEHMYPFTDTYITLDAQSIGIEPAAGFFRLILGSVVFPQGLFRTTYTAGFATVPDDVMEATALYAADELQLAVSQGAYLMQQGKQRAQFGMNQQSKSLFVQRAEDILDKGYRKRT
jgi:hypothetical protein